METQGAQQTPGRDGDASAERVVRAEASGAPVWTVEYFKANPLSVAWQSMLAIGGLILALHFVHIGFFPDMDWQSSLALVAIVALTGLLVWCFICLMLVFPAFTWSVVLEDLEKVPGSLTESGRDKLGEVHAGSNTSTLEHRASTTPMPPPPSPQHLLPGNQNRPDLTRRRGPMGVRRGLPWGDWRYSSACRRSCSGWSS